MDIDLIPETLQRNKEKGWDEEEGGAGGWRDENSEGRQYKLKEPETLGKMNYSVSTPCQ